VTDATAAALADALRDRYVPGAEPMTRSNRLLGMTLIGVLIILACRREVQEAQADRHEQWDRLVEEFILRHFEMNPNEAVNAGRHEFDGRMPDFSPEGLQSQIERLKQFRERATRVSGLDQRRGFERDYLIARIDHDLFWRAAANWPARNPFFYADPLDPSVYLTREYAPSERRMRAYTGWAQKVPAAVRQMEANLRTPLPRPYIQIAHITYGGLASYLPKHVPGIFAAVEDRELRKEFEAANQAATDAFVRFDRWLRAQEPTATNDFPLGSELFRAMLKETEAVDVSLDDLREAGERDLERNLQAVREACAAFAPGASPKTCVARVEAKKPKGSPVEAARRQLKDLKRFLVEKDLVTIPGPEEARVEEAPEYKRWNFAYIEIPGPYERNLPSIYYIAPPDPSWPRKVQQDYIPGEANLLFTSVHEVWPGHFLNFLHSNRAPSKFGQIFVGYAFAEGWAHYTEEMVWEAGLGDGDPEVRLGQLLNALLRNCRYLSTIGLHTSGMTVEQAQELFEEKCLQDPGNAEQQARRGTFDPAYLNYTMGKLMIRKLRDDWTASRGGRRAWKQFHDEFLSFGGPPVPMVRRAMMGGEPGALFADADRAGTDDHHSD
jgi:hypothetical protein